MSLTRLEVTGVRNISTASLELYPGINLIIGANGSGKTSLLESVYFLGSARTYRNASITPLITHDREECLVRGEIKQEFVQHNLGVLRDRIGSRDIRIDGNVVKKATDLAYILPTLVVGPETVNLLLGAPSLRRRFLNWGVFHMEHSFNQVWINANRCLKQRNTLLRHRVHKTQNVTLDELDTWTLELVKYTEELDRIRSKYALDFAENFHQHCQSLTELKDVTFKYERGWSAEQPLAEIYERDREIDYKSGFTRRGFHRADVRIRIDGHDVSSVCSRGELKVLSWAMVLSQGALLGSAAANNLVFLVDDLTSELDEQHQKRFCSYLTSTGNQILITGMSKESLVASWKGQALKVFHVEHGKIKQIEEQLA